MDIITSMKRSMHKRNTRTDLHITLPTEEVRHLDRMARDLSRTRNDLVCEAVTAYRIVQKKTAVQAAMRADAEAMAEDNRKILREFEPHAIDVLMRGTEW